MKVVMRIAALLLVVLALVALPRPLSAMAHHAAAPVPCDSHMGTDAPAGGHDHSRTPWPSGLACAAWCAIQCTAVPARIVEARPAILPFREIRLPLSGDFFAPGLNPPPAEPPPRASA